MPYDGIEATNRMADTRATPNRQATAAAMIVCIMGTPVHVVTGSAIGLSATDRLGGGQ